MIKYTEEEIQLIKDLRLQYIGKIICADEYEMAVDKINNISGQRTKSDSLAKKAA